MPFDGHSQSAATLRVIDGLIEQFGIPHPKPAYRITSFPGLLSASLRIVRRQLGIKGDQARRCILKSFATEAWPVSRLTLASISLTITDNPRLENILLRARDLASGEPMRPYLAWRPEEPWPAAYYRFGLACCIPERRQEFIRRAMAASKARNRIVVRPPTMCV
jgi:hypothetical protein